MTILTLPLRPADLVGIDETSIRVFRWNDRLKTLEPVWNSGVNAGHGYTWAKIEQSGDYVAIGLPRDHLLREVLRVMALQRRYADANSPRHMKEISTAFFGPLIQMKEEDMLKLRRSLAATELQTTLRPLAHHRPRIRRGGYTEAFPLPGDMTHEELKQRLKNLRTPHGGLPEEALFFRPEAFDSSEAPWPVVSGVSVNLGPAEKLLPEFEMPELRSWPQARKLFSWRTSRDWPMYQHDIHHTGHASGHSPIDSTTVGGLTLRLSIPLNGTVYTMPSIDSRKVYIGTVYVPGGIGTLYKIDLASGNIEHTFNTPPSGPNSYAPGIGGSPTIVDGKVYISNIPGTVHCLHAGNLTEHWHIDLRVPNQAKNQPVNNPIANCWSGPLVIGDRVYVGCGEGENGAYGFVYCLNAHNGHVIWLFSTNQYGAGNNAPNAIPASAAVSNPLPDWATDYGFTVAPDITPGGIGCSVWSSCAYDAVSNRIFVGTGNSSQGDSVGQPDLLYGSGVLALDATTGAFQGFYEPTAAQSYLPTDDDADVCGSPTVFARGGKRYVVIGSKTGALFLFEAASMNLVHSRQMLPYINDNPAQPLPSFDNHPGFPDENKWGVFGTPAVHAGLKRVFVGVGGYAGADSTTTPFIRALHWTNLSDAWPTVVGGDGVRRYSINGAQNPVIYDNSGQAGLSSPTVVNDVVFIGTTKPGLYALDAATGLGLWSAPGLSTTGQYVMGAAISGKYVVVGCGNNLNIYSL